MYAPLFEAVRDFFKQTLWRGKPVPVVFAGPDRAHEEIRRMMKRRGAGPDRQQADRAGYVPFMSLWIAPPKFHSQRFSPASVPFLINQETGNALKARFPRPVQTEVQVDLWCGSAGGHAMAQLIESQVEMRFLAENILLPVDWGQAKWYREPYNVSEHARYFGKTKLNLITEGWSDTSDLEAGEGPKEVRRTWSGRMEALIPHRPEEARLVGRVVMDICDYNHDLLDTVTVGEE